MKMAVLFFILASWIIPSLSCAADKSISALTVIGAVETLSLVKEKIQLPARIDTGAQTSSLSAIGIQPFERDGKRWLRFQIKDPATDKLIELKMALERITKIKRHGALAVERPVVSIVVAIGTIKKKCEFSLVDRTDYKYPALIGRNFLKGKALVDVSREYIVHPINKEEANAN